MDMYKLKFTRLQNEILRLLCIKTGQVLNQNSIARSLRVSPTAVSKALPLLVRGGLVTLNKKSPMKLSEVALNRDNSQAAILKRLTNLRLLYESGLVSTLEDKIPGATIIVFGSYSFGEDNQSSDIDITIVGSTTKEIDLDTYEKLLERSISLHFYKNLNKLDEPLKRNIYNGVVLSGAL